MTITLVAAAEPEPRPQPGQPTPDPEPIRTSPWQHRYLTAVDPGAHRQAHPAPIAGCPWCPRTACPSCRTTACPDPSGHRRTVVAGEAWLLTGGTW